MFTSPGGGTPKMSNELEVRLPLGVQYIQLPPRDARVENEDLYREYLEVRPGEANIGRHSNRVHSNMYRAVGCSLQCAG